ncbi:hypothetical protein [Halopiger thermotolerans]
MGFAGTAAAQEDTENLTDNIIEQTIGDLEANQEQNLSSGDASVNVNVDQTNNNAQTGSAASGDALAAGGSGGGAGAAAADHYKSGGGAVATADGASTGATAFSTAEVAQSQDVDQTNAADIDATAESGDVEGEQDLEQEPEQESEVGDVTFVDEGAAADDNGDTLPPIESEGTWFVSNPGGVVFGPYTQDTAEGIVEQRGEGWTAFQLSSQT